MISIKKIQLQWALTHIDALTHARSHTQTHTDTHRHIHSHTQTRIDTSTQINNVIKMTTTLRTVSFWLSCFDFPMQWTALQEVEYRAIGNVSFAAHIAFMLFWRTRLYFHWHASHIQFFFHSKLDAILRIGALLCVRIVSNRMYLVKSDFL